MGELSKLTNIGKTVEEQLAGVSIDSVGELKRIGTKEAWLSGLYWRNKNIVLNLLNCVNY